MHINYSPHKPQRQRKRSVFLRNENKTKKIIFLLKCSFSQMFSNQQTGDSSLRSQNKTEIAAEKNAPLSDLYRREWASIFPGIAVISNRPCFSCGRKQK